MTTWSASPGAATLGCWSSSSRRNDFGVHSISLQQWVDRADIDERIKPGQIRTESAERRETGTALPPLTELAVDGVPVAVTCRSLNPARQHY